MTDFPALPASPPLVIGATGGSGTRVIARIAGQAGFELGTNLNVSHDALEFLPFHEKWIDRFLELQKGGPLVPATDTPEQLKNDFTQVIGRHLAAVDPAIREPGQRWGWKAPRSIYLLPFFHAIYPEMKFIHVLRDGRDMAFSRNQNQLRKHGRRLLSWRERWFAPRALRSILLWDRVNGRAADYAREQLGGNYLLVRFENLCLAPVETTAAVLKFLEAPGDAAAIAAEEIKAPSSLGRWRSQPPDLIARMEAAAARSLRHFSYLPSGS